MSADNKHQILETISAVSHLITLAFKPNQTKISIRDHHIIICEPMYIQAVTRCWYGDSRYDIHIINHVIRNFIEWYIIPAKENDQELYGKLINMAKYLCVGLKKLRDTYTHGTVVLVIQYYIIVLLAVINDTYYPEMMYNILESNKNIINISNNQNDGNNNDELMCSTIFDIDKIKKFWKRDKLIQLCEQFDKCFIPYEHFHEYSINNQIDNYVDEQSEKYRTHSHSHSHSHSHLHSHSQLQKEKEKENYVSEQRKYKNTPSSTATTIGVTTRDIRDSKEKENDELITKIIPSDNVLPKISDALEASIFDSGENDNDLNDNY
jgi:hypothetical protein